MNNALRWSLVFVPTFVISLVGSAPVFATTLFVPESITFPLTLLVMAILAALTAGWVTNLVAGDSKRSRILPITGVTEIAALLLSLLRIQFSPNILTLAFWGAIVSSSGCIAALKFRDSERDRKKELVTSFILLAIAPLTVMVAIEVASRMGLTGG